MASAKETPYQAMSGQPETSEPGVGHDGSGSDAERPSKIDRRSQSSSRAAVTRPSNLASVHSSAASSPKPSRESSPIRPSLRSGTYSASKPTRSRKNSQDFSPSRTPSASGVSAPSVPSAAAVQRALASANIPQMQPTVLSEPQIKAPRPRKASASSSGDNTPRWPVSPRLKSPPPASSSIRPSILSPRKAESQSASPNIFLQRSTPPPTAPRAGFDGSTTDPEPEEHATTTGMRTPARGASGNGPMLETVQESSLPATPALETARGPNENRESSDDRTDKVAESSMEDSVKSTKGSESESGGNKSDDKSRKKSDSEKSSSRPNTLPPQRSYTKLNTLRGKAGAEGLAKNMTVETETVSSIPQVALGGGAGERGSSGRADTNGSIRMKPSVETIRPKKEKKRIVRKAPSINSGTASSKADIFEAKVASAVDEANSSDSEETFVYESNPPDPHPPRAARYHSRTPSATSVQSLIDHRGGVRALQGLADGNHSVVAKRSMKFAHNPYNSGHEGEGGERGDAARDGRTGSGRGAPGNSTHRHHHIGRFGRGGGGHTSLFDNDSPFQPPSKPLRSNASSLIRQSSRPSSPRNPHALRLAGVGNGKKAGEVLTYDIDGEGADDERTPLVGSMRVTRSRSGRRPNSASVRQMDYYNERHRGWATRLAGCIVLTVMVILVISGAVGFLFATTKPLLHVRVQEIQNVLASEQEIMLDLLVKAVNPNVVAISVGDMDVNVFAKSKYVGSDHHHTTRPPATLARPNRKNPRLRGLQSEPPSLMDGGNHYHTMDDDNTDPMPDPGGDSQTMLLGRIFEFDSALLFDGSPFKHHFSSSIGEVRLAAPGNKTEAGGTERWEKIVQHPFELIVRGVLRYQLPLSTRVRTAPIGSSVIVDPGKGVDDDGGTELAKSPSGDPHMALASGSVEDESFTDFNRKHDRT
ncbi:MAG: hypothetical protein M1819_000978 [Sarea resinae]|nr:MAG: hypothetical protein M1819_000978 [Sarea resinae]